MLDQANKDIPVYKVKRQDGVGKERTLHRNHLLPLQLPFNQAAPVVKLKQRTLPGQSNAIKDVHAEESTASESSEDEDLIISLHTQPVSEKEDEVGSRDQGSVSSSMLPLQDDVGREATDDESDEVVGLEQEDDNHRSRSCSPEATDAVVSEHSIGEQVEGGGDEAQLEEGDRAEDGHVTQVVEGERDASPDPPLRTSKRTVRAPQKYSDYILNYRMSAEPCVWERKVATLVDLLPTFPDNREYILTMIWEVIRSH